MCSGASQGFRNASDELAVTFSPKALADGLRAIYNKDINVTTEIERSIFDETLRLFNLATAKGLAESVDPEVITDRFLYELRTNNAVFSAFKTHRMQNDIAAQLIDPLTGQLKSFDRWKLDIKGMTDHYCIQWLQTEYDTAIIRAHQAADWKHFVEEADVFPNVRWMPTTSVTPDPLHQHYWEKKLTLPVNHPFWDEHHPGDRWNCKCSLQQTDDPVNASALDGYTPPLPMPGLDNNPAKDGKLFSDTHPYYTEAYPGAEDATKKLLEEKTYTFVAHSVEEAEKFVTDYIADRVDFPFKKSQLESASKALSLLKERMDYYGLSKFSILKAPEKKGALAAFEDFDNSFRISPKLFGDLTKIFETEQKFLKRYGYPYSTMHTSVDDILRSVIDHELGHAIKFRHPEWQGKIIQANASDKGSTRLLGYYSSTNLDEYFAEVIAAYWGPLYKDMSKVEIDLVEDLFKEAGFKMKPLKL